MDDRRKSKTGNSFLDNNDVVIFMQNVKAKIAEALKSGVKTIGRKGSYRSMYYMCPSSFYNHGSKTFLKNKRKGM